MTNLSRFSIKETKSKICIQTFLDIEERISVISNKMSFGHALIFNKLVKLMKSVIVKPLKEESNLITCNIS